MMSWFSQRAPIRTKFDVVIVIQGARPVCSRAKCEVAARRTMA